jgi:HTH-type transcriptional regulator/antitoxin HipB
LGAAIKEARVAAGRTQIELAQQSGLNRHAVMALESGHDTKAMRAIFDALAALDLELIVRRRGDRS